MNPIWVFPPVLVVAALVAWLGSKVSPRIRATVNRIGRVLCGRFVPRNTEREGQIESAFIETTYRTYAATTVLYTLLGLVAGAIAGAYLLAGLLTVLEPIVHAMAGLPDTMTRPLGIHSRWKLRLSETARWLLLLGGGLVIGIVTAAIAYSMRWQLPTSTAEVRRRSIDEGLPRTTAFMYALARGGMEFPEILRTLTEYDEVYGETARELSVTVREMDLFGRDMITAIRRMSGRTPSEQFKTFSENLSSVLQSGSDLSTFLNEQYERFREEAEERQEEVLELLATLAEAYVTVLVALVLFLITILLVFGLTTTDTLPFLKMIIYLMVPLANAGFAVFLQQKLDQLGVARRSGGNVLERMDAATPSLSMPTATRPQADGGLAHEREQDNRRMLDLYDRVNAVKQLVRSPLQMFLTDPTKLLWATVPIAVGLVLVRLPRALQAEGITIRILDDLLIQSVLFVLITYAIVREIYKRRIDRMEAATPELLERLASLNEAGMSVVEGFDRVRGSDLGVLSPEVERIWRDIEYGANIDDALIRFGRRVRTTAITRVVTLLANAMRASGEMGPVLRIASEQARAEVKLRRQRRQKMFTYLIVIYVSFLVFLVIIGAVNEVLVPSLPDSVPSATEGTNRLGTNADAFTRFGEVNQAAYTLVFFHAVMVQALCAGFIGGQLGEGSLRDGAKHAAIMLTVAYIVVLLMSAPVASVSDQDTTTNGDALFVQSASLSEGGFVAVYVEDGLTDSEDGRLVGHSAYLAPGKHTGIWVPLQNGTIPEDATVRVVAHQDTNGNEAFDFSPPYDAEQRQTDRPYKSLSSRGTPGSEIDVSIISAGDESDE